MQELTQVLRDPEKISTGDTMPQLTQSAQDSKYSASHYP